MNTNRDFELNGSTDPHVVETFLRKYGWQSYNGHIRAEAGAHTFQPLAVDIRSMYSIYVREVEVVDEDNNHVNAVRVLLQFHGGKELHTRVYPLEEQVWKELMMCFIWLRDYYLGLAEHEIFYSPVPLFEVLEKPQWDSYRGEVDKKTSVYKWTVKQ